MNIDYARVIRDIEGIDCGISSGAALTGALGGALGFGLAKYGADELIKYKNL